MIAILLAVLKWIGILVLWILGILVALLLILLLVPIRYRIKGSRSAQDGNLSAGGKVSWLLSIFAVTFSYDHQFSWQARICGFPLRLGQTSTEDGEDELADVSEDALKSLIDDDFIEEEELTPEQLSQIAWWDHKEDTPSSLVTQEVRNNTQDPETASKHPDEPKVPWQEKLRAGWQKFSGKIRSIPAKISVLKEKIRSLKEKADTWIAFAKTDEVKELVTLCKKQTRQILRHLLPTNLKVIGNYGFEDPSLTGKVTGAIYALPPRLQKNIHLQPHFQEECLDGEIAVKGRIRLGSLVWPLLVILVKPCTWKTLKKYRSITDPDSSRKSSKSRTEKNKGTKKKKKKKKRSGKSGVSHKKKEKRNQNDPHKGGNQ